VCDSNGREPSCRHAINKEADSADSAPHIEIQRQAAFGATGELEVSDDPVESSLVDVG
jgi:hypothetical protein